MIHDRGIEARILERCRAGDPAAARELVTRHQRALLRVAGRLLGRWDVAEEIVQESFLRAFERIEEIDPQRGALGWLLRTVVHLSRDWQRHSSRREESSPVGADARPLFTGAVPEPEGMLVASERRERLARALDRLPLPLREVVVLRYIEDLPFDVITSITGVRSTALRVRALRARARLRALLEDDRP